MMQKLCIINMGGARCGTTACFHYFKSHPSVSTPNKEKEIKAFFKNISWNTYLTYFPPEAEVLFESSPPYMGRGLDEFKLYIDRIDATIQVPYVILFNLRALAERAFSHYWHEINKHHSIFGRYWKVRTKNDPARYEVPYKLSFTEAIALEPQKFLPDYLGMICYAGQKLGWERISVILQSNLAEGIRHFSQNVLGLGFNNNLLKKVSGARAPIFLMPDDPRRDQIKHITHVSRKSLLRIGHDGIEELKASDFDIQAIYEASRNWTKRLSGDEVHSIFSEYLLTQSRKLVEIPHSSLVIPSEVNVRNVLFKKEPLKISSHWPPSTRR